jgi:hypothetical protein
MDLTNAEEHAGRELKWRRILGLLAEGRQLTRFDVEPHGDHCFNTSVSVISKKGIQISRKPIVVDGRFGRFRCKLYWLEADQIERARCLLGAA